MRKTRRKARLLADAVCKAFIQWKKELATKNARETLDTLTSRAAAARKQMVDAEQKELAFKNKSGMVNVNEQQASILDEYLKRSIQVSDLAQDLTVQRQRLQSLQKALASTSSKIQTGTGVRDDSLVLGLQQQVNQLEREYAAAKIRFTADYPLPEGPTQIQQRLAVVKKQLNAALKTTLNDTASLDSQKSLSDTYNQAKIELISTEAKFAAASQAEAKLKRSAVGCATGEHGLCTHCPQCGCRKAAVHVAAGQSERRASRPGCRQRECGHRLSRVGAR
jgi:uncharacterized protein involved in exopolysaccharide biosynthesis